MLLLPYMGTGVIRERDKPKGVHLRRNLSLDVLEFEFILQT